jgi:predicted metalloprotease with PDZ domain
VQWGGPAYQAGLSLGGKLIAVNSLAYDDSGDVKDAITRAVTDKAPIELLVRYGDHFQTARIDYHGGLKYPHLQREPGTPDRLDDILAAVK